MLLKITNEFLKKSLLKLFQAEVRAVSRLFPAKFVVERNSPSASLMSNWINARAKNIFEESALVEHALALLHCAQINGDSTICKSKMKIVIFRLLRWHLPTKYVAWKLLQKLDEILNHYFTSRCRFILVHFNRFECKLGKMIKMYDRWCLIHLLVYMTNHLCES